MTVEQVISVVCAGTAAAVAIGLAMQTVLRERRRRRVLREDV